MCVTGVRDYAHFDNVFQKVLDGALLELKLLYLGLCVSFAFAERHSEVAERRSVRFDSKQTRPCTMNIKATMHVLQRAETAGTYHSAVSS